MNAAAITPDGRVDVLIVGLGPAGGAAAAACARAGLRVLAIDKKHRIGEPVQCAEFIPLPLARYAQADGVAVQRIGGMKSFLPSGAVDAAKLSGMVVNRAAFDRALAAEAVSAGALLHLRTRLVQLDPRAQRARIETGAADVDGRDIAYRLLIAADGPHSTVAKCLGLPPLATVRTRQYTVPLRTPYTDTDIWLADDFPGGYAWLFPKGAVANIGVGIDPRFTTDLKAPLARVHAQAVARGMVGEGILRRTGGAIPVGGMRSTLAQDRTLFVGDAAGLTHPISGAGIAAAVISGERAAAAAVEYLRAGNAAALTQFEDDVREQFAHTLARALARRAQLADVWRTPAARSDGAMRRGWIAFAEYFGQ